MNRQKEVGVTREEAYSYLAAEFMDKADYFYKDYLEYWAYPEVFANTGGPFKKPGGVYGQAFTTWTIEAWVCGHFAVLFCGERLIKVTDKWEGPQTVRI